MNVLYRAFCRVYQFCFHLALPVLPYRQPQRLANLDEIPALLRRLGEGAKRSFEENYTGEIFAKHVEDVYRDVLKGVSHGTK